MRENFDLTVQNVQRLAESKGTKHSTPPMPTARRTATSIPTSHKSLPPPKLSRNELQTKEDAWKSRQQRAGLKREQRRVHRHVAPPR